MEKAYLVEIQLSQRLIANDLILEKAEIYVILLEIDIEIQVQI